LGPQGRHHRIQQIFCRGQRGQISAWDELDWISVRVDRILVEHNLVEFSRILVRYDSTKFQSGSTLLDLVEFRLRSILHNTTKFLPELTWPNMATFGPGLDQSNFDQGWFH